MPVTAKESKKEEKIQLRIKSEDKDTLEKAASALGITTSSFIISNALRAAKKELSSNASFAVSADDGKILAKLLENPPKPNLYLKKTAKSYLGSFSVKKSK